LTGELPILSSISAIFSKGKKGNDLAARVIATLQDCRQGPDYMDGI